MKRIRGIDLTEEELGVINQNRVLEFEAKRMLDPKTNPKDARDFFYLIERDGGIKGFVRLGKEKFRYLGEDFEMWCFSTLIAIEKNKGYSRELLGELKKFSDENGVSIVGFCLADLKEYYLKNGLGTLSSEENKYYYIDKDGVELPEKYSPGEVVFIDGRDNFFENLKNIDDKRVGFWLL